MPWSVFTNCQKGNHEDCPGEIRTGTETIFCACPHHHLPTAQPARKPAAIICFGCRVEIGQDDLLTHAHLDISVEEDYESDTTSEGMGDLRLHQMRSDHDRPSA